MTASGTLGDYLKARRELIRPGDVGLPEGDRRRSHGLRRDEVAMLAGISAEYYLGLEEGRDRNPSEQVLDSIASALQLDGEAASHLRRLALPEPTTGRRSARGEVVSPGIQSLILNFTSTPVYVQSRTLEVVAANPLAVALSPFFAVGSNPIRATFLEPEMRTFYRDWDDLTAKTVPYLRSVIGAEVDDPRLVTLIGELSLGSERFRSLWARDDAQHESSGVSRMLHPQVGPLDLNYEHLDAADDNLVMVAFYAQPGSESEERLKLLASLV